MRLMTSDLERDGVLARLVADDVAVNAEPVAAPRLADREVLVVDDDAQREFVMGRALQSAGARVRFVSQPRRAGLQAALAQQAGCPYHVVILNLDLPDVQTGGAAAIRRHGYDGPLLGVTAATGAARRAMGVGLGCADVLSLPIVGDELVDHAARAIERHELDAAASSLTHASSTEGEAVASRLAAYPQLQAMLEKFVERLPGQVDRLLAAAEAHDRDALAELSRQIQQASVRHGYDGFARRASQLHQHADADAALEHLADEARELADLCRKLTLRPLGGPTKLPPRA